MRACLDHATLSILASGSASFNRLSASEGFAPVMSNIALGSWDSPTACCEMGSSGAMANAELLNLFRACATRSEDRAILCDMRTNREINVIVGYLLDILYVFSWYGCEGGVVAEPYRTCTRTTISAYM